MKLIKKYLNTPGPITFGLWTPDSVAKYEKLGITLSDYQLKNLSKSALFSNVDYTSNMGIFPFSQNSAISKNMEDALKANKRMCLKGTLNYESNLAPYWGVPGIRLIMSDIIIPDNLRMLEFSGKFDMKGKPIWEKGWINSWNFPFVMALYPEKATVVKTDDFLKAFGMKKWDAEEANKYLPLHFESNGNAQSSGYISPKYGYTDKYGNPYPAHTYLTIGFILAKDGKLYGLYNDYGMPSTDHRLHGAPKYLIIPNVNKPLLMNNIMPQYLDWENRMNNAHVPFIKGLDKVNSSILNFNPKEMILLNEYYGIGDTDEILKRLMAIGALESRLGYNLEGEDYKTNIGRKAKYYTPGVIKSLGKLLESPNAEDATIYDTKAGYLHEMDIYNRLLNARKLKGLSVELIRLLVADEYNKEAKIWENANTFHSKYGSKSPKYEIFNNSTGPFQLKASNVPLHNFKNMYGRIIENGTADDIYLGDNDTMKAYNRFLANMLEIKKRYPELSDSQLIDAATISWNAPSKLTTLLFIDLYIKDLVLTDNYLEKVKSFLNKLYPTE